MSPVAIVAIPNKDDYIWNISSETVPHLTILTLGEMTPTLPVNKIAAYLEHVVNTSLCRFGLDVDRRGVLGANQADVLFFSKWGTRKLEQFRSYLLANTDIQAAYNSSPQFPVWTPHLTLGFPETPAKPDPRDYPGTSWVNFDTVALWTGDFKGLEFPLDASQDWEMSMSDEVSEFLEHFGVKGQKWGVRRSERRLAAARKVKESASEDANRAGEAFGKLHRTGIHSLSNAELKSVVDRMQLEQSFARVAPVSKKKRALRAGGKFAGDILVGVGKTQITKLASDQATKLVAGALKR